MTADDKIVEAVALAIKRAQLGPVAELSSEGPWRDFELRVAQAAIAAFQAAIKAGPSLLSTAITESTSSPDALNLPPHWDIVDEAFDLALDEDIYEEATFRRRTWTKEQ